MNSLKAIFTGVLFIIITIMIMQLVYIIAAVGYNSLAKDYPYLKEITGVFRYLIAIPIIVLIMFAGGYLTAIIAKKKEVLHSLIVGVITIGAMMWSALANAELTSTGYIINALMLTATIAGGWYWKKRQL